MFIRNVIDFKANQTTNPSKLASAIVHNIVNADIRVNCLGPQAVCSAIKALIIAKKYAQNNDYKLTFDFYSVDETDAEGATLNIIQVLISKVDIEKGAK